MKRISNIFICLLIALTTSVLSINASIAEDGRPDEVFDGSSIDITEDVYAPEDIYTAEQNIDTEETKLN